MSDPFFLPPQSVLSFSGGRTSGYMLWRHLQSHGGALPPDRVPVFCNTGKECEETLGFVRECSTRWGVPIVWLEYRWEPGRHYFEVVDYETASRDGQPFSHVIRARGRRGYLPNPIQRHCTIEMKLRTTNRFVRHFLKWETYFNAIGLRGDEPARVAKVLSKGTTRVVRGLFGDEEVEGGDNLPGETPVCPLAAGGVTLTDVLKFWQDQPFDLRLGADERTGKTAWGNCDLCFLKGAANLVELIRQRPEAADWWIAREDEVGAGFRKDRPRYFELKQIALGQAEGPGWLWADKGGMACGGVSECNCTD